jgi:phosphate transport system permease protein
MTTLARTGSRLSGRTSRGPDRAFRAGARTAALAVVLLLLALTALLVLSGAQAFGQFGLIGFITGTTWDPVREVYGALPYVIGTLASSAIAMLIATPIALLTAIYLAELAPRRVAIALTFTVELIAAIPSVVIGLWGVFVLTPFLRDTAETWLIGVFGGWLPIFSGPAHGVSLFAAGVILAIMILPTIVSISREVIASVPNGQREAMYALGATRWEMVTKAVLPYARSGIIGALILGLGRALGETMAVTMVIGNSSKIPNSVFDQAQTISSQIATTFSEAQAGIQTSSLIALGLVLLVVTLALNAAARLLVARTAGSGGSAR